MNLVTLECPLCRGMIQVDASAAGQQVACPLCQRTMQVPPAEALAAALALEPVPPPPELYSAPRQPPAGIFSSVPLELMALACPSCGGMFQVPPSAAGLELPCPSCHKLVTIPAPTAAAAAPAAPAVFSPPPPAAGEADKASSLLPPGAGSSSAAAVSIAPVAAYSAVESLLPPGASDAPAAPGEHLALPQAPRPILVSPAGAPAGAILVPTPDGKVIALQQRPKILGEGDQQVEIKRLTPAEKARRRTVRNVVLFILGLAGLLAIVIYLSR